MDYKEINKKWQEYIQKNSIRLLFKNKEKATEVLRKMHFISFQSSIRDYAKKMYDVEFFYENKIMNVYRMISQYELCNAPYTNGCVDSYQFDEIMPLNKDEGKLVFEIFDDFIQKYYDDFEEVNLFERYDKLTKELYEEISLVKEKYYPEIEISGFGCEWEIDTDDGKISISSIPFVQVKYTLIRNRKHFFDCVIELQKIKKKQKESIDKFYDEIKKDYKIK